MLGLSGVVEGGLVELRRRSQLRAYREDPELWVREVLGKRWYSRQREIAEAFLGCSRVAVKSGNGVGKSAVMADLITWVVATHDPAETLCIVTAPTLSQIEKVVFAYLKVNKGLALERGFELPGRITETLAWKLDGVQGSEFLVFGKRPSDRDITSSFQGTRKRCTLVFMDEAGGLPAEMFTAAEAVATGAGSKIFAIGNPDRRGTEFHRIFSDERLMQDWCRQTISVFDLPTFTGEVVYDDPVRQAGLLESLTSVEWVEHKKRAWGVDSARFKAKILGEFPDEGDNSIFSQAVLDAAYDRVVEVDVRPVLGVDIARYGQDESRMYSNQGGCVRFVDGWSKESTVESARRIHRHAQDLGAVLVNVDANGVGAGVVDMLLSLDEFRDATYSVGSIVVSNSSPDPKRWLNLRAFMYDSFAQLLADGVVDLDYEDDGLRDELIAATYVFTDRGQLQVTSKESMRKRGLRSPDSLDAVLLACLNVDDVAGPSGVGDVVEFDDEVLPGFYSGGNGFW